MLDAIDQGPMPSRRWPRIALTFLLALVMPSMVVISQPDAARADVEVGDTVWVGGKQGYGGTGLFAIYESGSPTSGEPDYWAYCIEQTVTARTNAEGTAGDFTSFLGDNHFLNPGVSGKVLWVLAHSYPAVSLADFGAVIGAPGISRNDAIEATQYAIWRYTDLTFDASWSFETPDSETAYWYLVDGANAAATDDITLDDFEVTATLTAPTTAQTADSLVGPFTVATNQPSASVTVSPSVPLVDATGAAIDATAVVDGQEIFLDLRGSVAAGSATVTVEAQGSSAMGKVISVATSAGGTPTVADHAQSIILVAPSTKQTTADATVNWAAIPPVIGTTLVDAADQDHVLAWDGGTLVDTVAYQNLVPGLEYTLAGELMNGADGSATGIVGSVTFTPVAADGSIDVVFVVPAGFAGQALVAFERLFEGDTATGVPVAVHEDINDPAQTVTVEDAPGVQPPVVQPPVVDPTGPPPSRSTPKLTTQASKKRARPGARLFDRVKLSGFVAGHGAIGRATLYGPFAKRSEMACSPAHVVKTVRFTPKNGVVRTPKVRVTEPGLYTWVARTTADSRNRAATHACGLRSETTLVRKPGYRSPVVDTGFSSAGAPAARAVSARVSIPAIGVRASTSSVGIDRGRMQIPGDVSRLGQLNRSAGLGDLIGTTVIAGHVSDRQDRPGAFWRLASARKGQVVTVREGNKTVRYKVTRVERFDRAKRLPKRLFRTTGAHRLVLISCSDRVSTPGGGFHYRSNVVVTAERLEN